MPLPKHGQQAHQLGVPLAVHMLLARLLGGLRDTAATLAGARNKHVDLPVLPHKAPGETSLLLFSPAAKSCHRLNIDKV